MKVKKIIKKNWNLEAKDNLTEIKEQLSFDEQAPNFLKQYKYKMIFGSLSCACLVLICVISGFFILNNFGGFDLNDPSSPNENINDAPTSPIKPADPDSPTYSEPSDPQAPSAPGEEDSSTYLLFIEELKQNTFASDYLSYIAVDGETITDNDKIKSLCEFLNSLTYSQSDDKEDDSYDYKISFNDWASIVIGEASHIRIMYDDVIVTYDTNQENILAQIEEILK